MDASELKSALLDLYLYADDLQSANILHKYATANGSFCDL